MSRKEENGNMETRATSELCSNSLPRRLAGNGKVECWARDMRKIAAAPLGGRQAGNMAIPFQSEAKRNQHGGQANRIEVNKWPRRPSGRFKVGWEPLKSRTSGAKYAAGNASSSGTGCGYGEESDVR